MNIAAASRDPCAELAAVGSVSSNNIGSLAVYIPCGIRRRVPCIFPGIGSADSTACSPVDMACDENIISNDVDALEIAFNGKLRKDLGSVDLRA